MASKAVRANSRDALLRDGDQGVRGDVGGNVPLATFGVGLGSECRWCAISRAVLTIESSEKIVCLLTGDWDQSPSHSVARNAGVLHGFVSSRRASAASEIAHRERRAEYLRKAETGRLPRAGD